LEQKITRAIRPSGTSGRNPLADSAARRNMYVQNHCYRADEMAQHDRSGTRVRIQDPFRFHHVGESYKIAEPPRQESVTSVSVLGGSGWGFKDEAMDGIQQNAAR